MDKNEMYINNANTWIPTPRRLEICILIHFYYEVEDILL